MIKIENVVLPSPAQWQAVIRGMRNPMNSWNLSDSYKSHIADPETLETADFEFFAGEADLKLMQKLCKAGTDHGKFMRMIPVYLDIVAPLYWWKEFDTYKVGTVVNSCSTMHKIDAKMFTLEDFSMEHLDDNEVAHKGECQGKYWTTSDDAINSTIEMLNWYRESFIKTGDKTYWWRMIQLLPSSYNQRRTVMLNYGVLRAMYNARKYHKLDEWRIFCKWIETLPYFADITMEEGLQ